MEIQSLKINQEISDIKEQLDGLLDIFYPVGSYYETSDSDFNPNTSWGGTWVEDTNGLVTVGSYREGNNRPGNDRLYITQGTIEGEAEHTLTESEMPSHRHAIGDKNLWCQASTYGYVNAGASATAGGCDIISNVSTYTGGSQAHNNAQPSIGVHRWHRTA